MRVGSGIAVAALCLAALGLELNGHESGGLWLLVVLCVIFGS